MFISYIAKFMCKQGSCRLKLAHFPGHADQSAARSKKYIVDSTAADAHRSAALSAASGSGC
jgi:hypothetical protein